MTMRCLYLAHKIRDPRGPYWMREHIRQAEKVALQLWEMGAAVICPGKNTMWFDGALPDDTWLAGDFEFIHRSDAVVMCPNSVTSVGAKAEAKFAKDLGKPVFYWPKDKAQIQLFITHKFPAPGLHHDHVVD